MVQAAVSQLIEGAVDVVQDAYDLLGRSFDQRVKNGLGLAAGLDEAVTAQQRQML